MTIPDYQTLMRPVLTSLADGQIRRSRDVIEAMADEFAFSPEERSAKVPSGQKRIDNRAALLSKQGDRGVFITTLRFTKGARDEAEHINARIELIDGSRLAELLVQYGIGVQPEQSVALYRLDEDFFDSI